MFSSSPFPELPLSPNVFITPNLLFDNEKECVCFNYHRSNTDPFTSDGCFFHSPPIMDGINSTIKQDLVSQQQEFSDEDLSDAVIFCSKGTKEATRASTSDGRSKIWTARGPRDRRVRLSIDISRKFFCLQDLLGFDKASKTLDWLFTKSKKAIKELVEECPSSTLDDQSKASFLESITGGSDEDNSGKEKRPVLKCVDGKKKIMVVQETNLAREQSRTMARARARERTREKMNIKKLNDKLKILVN